MEIEKHLLDKAAQLLYLTQDGGFKLTFAESCTGGLLAEAFTACPGASAVLEMSFVTYCDRAKEELLGVPAAMLAEHTAVSAPVAAAMAVGAKARAGADLALSVTGWAGPAGFCETWPVGLVYLGAAWQDKVRVWRCQFPGGRQLVRQQAALAALRQAIKIVRGENDIANK